jgi:hypothetical protein
VETQRRRCLDDENSFVDRYNPGMEMSGYYIVVRSLDLVDMKLQEDIAALPIFVFRRSRLAMRLSSSR